MSRSKPKRSVTLAELPHAQQLARELEQLQHFASALRGGSSERAALEVEVHRTFEERKVGVRGQRVSFVSWETLRTPMESIVAAEIIRRERHLRTMGVVLPVGAR